MVDTNVMLSVLLLLSRRDKYQRHVMEYWVDVRTSGSLSKSHKEEFSQYVEIIDDGTSLPPPTLGNEALPCYDDEDQGGDCDEDDEDDDEDDDKQQDTNPSTRHKRPRRGKHTPKTKKKREEKEKNEEVEIALEAGFRSNCWAVGSIKLTSALVDPCFRISARFHRSYRRFCDCESRSKTPSTISRLPLPISDSPSHLNPTCTV